MNGRGIGRRAGADRRAIAAVEFALIVPLILILIAGGADLGFVVWARSALSSAIAQGAYYAVLTGASVSSNNIVAMVEKSAGMSGVTATVAGPASYCTSGTPVGLTPAPNSGNCPDGTVPGSYVTISADVGAFSIGQSLVGFAGSTVRESATVRLQ